MRNRYAALYGILSQERPKSILEVGTYDGSNAVKMINAAGTKPVYYGFDLFDMLTPELIVKENSKQKIAKLEDAHRNLSKLGIDYTLHQGFTKDTLKDFDTLVDFVFIDGGHSEDTVKTDWYNIERLLKSTSIIVFDDYYDGMKPGFGCDSVIEELNYSKYETEFLQPEDMTAHGYLVWMVKVQQKQLLA